jgi:cytidylate kinase
MGQTPKPPPRAIRVAIDGPAGAGKSTVARGLAKRLGYVLLDTGALYRTVALAAQRAGVPWSDTEAMGALARALVEDDAIAVEASESAPKSIPPGVTLADAGGSGMRVRLRGEDVSFFLTASPEVRARRRFDELTARGKAVTLDETLADVVARDRADTERPVAPLRRAEDAILVDSSERPADEIIEEMARLVEARADRLRSR